MESGVVILAPPNTTEECAYYGARQRIWYGQKVVDFLEQ
jgi:hypothetical protein